MDGIDGGLHPAVDIEGGLHPAVDRQWTALMEGYILQWKALIEGYILQWTDNSGGH